MLANRFTYIPRPNWTRRAISRPKAQPRAARFLRSLLARTAPGTGVAAALVAAGSPLLASAIAHLRPMAPVRLVIAAPRTGGWRVHAGLFIIAGTGRTVASGASLMASRCWGWREAEADADDLRDVWLRG